MPLALLVWRDLTTKTVNVTQPPPPEWVVRETIRRVLWTAGKLLTVQGDGWSAMALVLRSSCSTWMAWF